MTETPAPFDLTAIEAQIAEINKDRIQPITSKARQEHVSGGRTNTKKRKGQWYKGPRTWKAGRKVEPRENKGRLTTVRVPPDMYDFSLVHGGLSAVIRFLWAYANTRPEVMDTVIAEAKLYYPYAGEKKEKTDG